MSAVQVFRQSGVLPWSWPALNNVPAITGVYCLRDNAQITYIGKAGTGRMQERLKEHANTGDIPNVAFFDWYECRSEADAGQLEADWLRQYKPRYNQVGVGVPFYR